MDKTEDSSFHFGHMIDKNVL